MTKATNPWQDTALAATRGSRLGAMLACALGRNPESGPRFIGRANISSDGYIFADFVDSREQYHFGALAGAASDLERNVKGLAAHCNFSKSQTLELQAAVTKWIASDYRQL